MVLVVVAVRVAEVCKVSVVSATSVLREVGALVDDSDSAISGVEVAEGESVVSGAVVVELA